MGLKLEPNPNKNKEFEPGPGNYNPIKSQKTLKYTMSAKHDTSLSPEKLTPGPGTYQDERELYYQTLPGSKMGKDNRKSYFLKSASYEKPGPGNYSTISFTEKSDAPKFGFGSSVREKDYKKHGGIPLVPGPGKYEARTVLGPMAGVPVYSMPGRREDFRPRTGKDAPDAGVYDPKHTFSSVKPLPPKFSVGKSKRDGNLKLYTDPPGATAYTPDVTLTKTHFASWRIGSEERAVTMGYTPKTPGPGTYESKSALAGPKFSMRSKHDHLTANVPGPGTYEPKHDFDAALRAAPAYS
jgi:Sperm-tail PG-rich repeat